MRVEINRQSYKPHTVLHAAWPDASNIVCPRDAPSLKISEYIFLKY